MFKFNPAIVLFVGFELCYYLLIAQTGIVEYFKSDLFSIIYLPIGGVIGSYLSSSLSFTWEKENNITMKVSFLLLIQILISIVYPRFDAFLLLFLGIAVGGMAPLMIHILKKANNIDLLLSLSIAYAAGTFLFTSDPSQRGLLSIILSAVPFISFFFIDKFNNTKKLLKNSPIYYPLVLMVIWVFLDSALFETLSRDENISIWRDGYTLEIMLFHIIGVIAGVYLKINSYQKSLIILILFALSYLFYSINQPLLLSIVYPIVISYYNVAILQNMVKIKSLKTIGIYMIFIGWIASGAGLFIALEQLTYFIPLLFVVIFLYMINQQNYISKTKEVYNG